MNNPQGLTEFQGFLCGGFGGIVIPIAECWALRKAIPAFSRSFFYWFISGIMAAAGGGLVLLHLMSADVRLSALAAFNIGATAPLTLSVFAKAVPRMTPGKKIN
jgi:hypothetical protein